MATQADGHAERDAAVLMLHEQQKNSSRRITVGADKAYDTKDFLAAARSLNVTPHVQKNEEGRRSCIDARTRVMRATPSRSADDGSWRSPSDG